MLIDALVHAMVMSDPNEASELEAAADQQEAESEPELSGDELEDVAGGVRFLSFPPPREGGDN
jgi:hypothetical protein